MKRPNFKGFKNRVSNFRGGMRRRGLNIRNRFNMKRKKRRKGVAHHIHRTSKFILPLVVVVAAIIAIYEFMNKPKPKPKV